MSLINKSHVIAHLAAALLWLPLMCACASDTDDHGNPTPSHIATADHYINLQIVVSTGSDATMRSPQGGENGDGREAGFERENHIEGITFMLYADNDGINTTKDDTQLVFVKYYPVSRDREPDPQGTTYDGKDDEATYTTGNQSLEGLDLSKEYHAIVVANVNLTTGDDPVQEGDQITVVRERVVSQIYTGDGIGTDAQKFIMASENDPTIDFSKPSTTDGKYYYTTEPLRIERLAARIDFWAKGATYKTYADELEGYEYPVTNTNNNSKAKYTFLLTAITPFNLYDKDEYLVKRITDDTSNDYSEADPQVKYLKNERVTTGPNHLNYVLDPLTYSKTGVPTDENGKYMKEGYRLDDILNGDNKMPLKNFQSDKYTHTEGGSSGDNLIVCYPKENTLWNSTPLYYYATGLRIEGYFYKNGEKVEGDPVVYYGFMRHQGEEKEGSESYKMLSLTDLDKYKERIENPDILPMNFGVVRNNIYRVLISSISLDGDDDTEEPPTPEITLQIKVKKWDKFTHQTIYM